MRMTIPRRCAELVKLHGGLRKAAAACDIDFSYFSRLRSGEKDNPADGTLRKLGLVRVITYETITSEVRHGE